MPQVRLALALAGLVALLRVAVAQDVGQQSPYPKANSQERQILLDLYEASGGGAWRIRPGGAVPAWDTSVSTCNWTGVHCCQEGEATLPLSYVLPSAVEGATLRRPCSKAGQVKALLLDGLGLEGTLPASIALLPGLEVLRLAGNSGLRGSLPPELLQLSTLLEVDLRGSGMDCGSSAQPCELPSGFKPSNLISKMSAASNGSSLPSSSGPVLQPPGATASCSLFIYRNWLESSRPNSSPSSPDAISSQDTEHANINSSTSTSTFDSSMDSVTGAARIAAAVALPPAGTTVLLTSPSYWQYQYCVCTNSDGGSGQVPRLGLAPGGQLQATCAKAPADQAATVGEGATAPSGGSSDVKASGVPTATFIGVVSAVSAVAGLAVAALVTVCCIRRMRYRPLGSRWRARKHTGKESGHDLGDVTSDAHSPEGARAHRSRRPAWLRLWRGNGLAARRRLLVDVATSTSSQLFLEASVLVAAGGCTPGSVSARAPRVGLSGSEADSLAGGLQAAKRSKPPGSYPAIFGQGVTLAATDVEGSTELWEWQPDVMNYALALHDKLMRLTLAACSGYEVTTEGDAFLVAFHEPVDAVRWALLLQSALLKLDWPPLLQEHPLCRPRPLVPVADPRVAGQEASKSAAAPLLVLFKGLAVRMGIATGVPSAIREHPMTGRMQYTGAVLRLATGIAEMGSGGQVLLEPLTFKSIHNKFEELDVVESEVQELADEGGGQKTSPGTRT